MMVASRNIAYYRGEGISAIRLPFIRVQGRPSTSMIFILPDNFSGINNSNMEDFLKVIDSLCSQSNDTGLDIEIPIFSVDSGDVDVIDNLKLMGLGEQANHMDMRIVVEQDVGSTPLIIGEVLQQIVFDVGLEADTAAAVTSFDCVDELVQKKNFLL